MASTRPFHHMNFDDGSSVFSIEKSKDDIFIRIINQDEETTILCLEDLEVINGMLKIYKEYNNVVS